VSGGFDSDDVGTDSTHSSAAVIPAWTSPASMEWWSNRTSISSRFRSASPLTRREAAQNALVRAGERAGLPHQGQSGGTGQCAGFGFEDLQIVIQLGGLASRG
jgi:hypothetical protein